MRNKFVKIILIIIFLSFFKGKIYAEGNFLSSYDTLYEINQDGITTVSQNISIINHKAEEYAKEYVLIIDSLGISNIVARDEDGQINTSLDTSGGNSKIHIFFNSPIVGLNKTKNFTIRYTSSEIAKKLGSIWQVRIPPVNNEDINSYNTKVRAANELGPLSYSWPKAKNNDTWDLNEQKNGIILLFGEKQIYDFSLNYTIANPKFSPDEVKIALPPDNAFQKVIIENIYPLPQMISEDKNGNWIATYSLKARESKNITAKIAVTVNSIVNTKDENIDINYYLLEDKQWEKSNINIQNNIKNLTTPYDVYLKTIELLNYDNNNGNVPIRRSINSIFENKNLSLCMQYTDLFITLARAIGIPARAVIGYAYTNNESERPLSFLNDVLHAWPEYYNFDKKQWIPVDPTWGETTGGVDYFNYQDLSHVAFVIWGDNISSPMPAGFYKANKYSEKDIKVTLLSNIPQPVKQEITTNLVIPSIILSGIYTDFELDLGNPSGVSITISDIKTSGQPYEFTQRFGTIKLAPFSEKKIIVKYKTPTYFNLLHSKVTYNIDGKEYNKTFLVLPIFIFFIPILPLLIVIIYRKYFKKLHIWMKISKKS